MTAPTLVGERVTLRAFRDDERAARHDDVVMGVLYREFADADTVGR